MGAFPRHLDFINKLSAYRGNERLFAFFLLDDRVSNEKVFEFFERNTEWIDSLSYSSGLVTLIPFSKWREKAVSSNLGEMEKMFFVNSEEMQSEEEEEEFLATIENKEYSFNLSLTIAAMFGIKPRELPGIVFFKNLPKSVPKKPIYIKLNEATFYSLKDFENQISELYSIVQEGWKKKKVSQDVLTHIDQILKSTTEIMILPEVEGSIADIFFKAWDISGTQSHSIGEFKYLTQLEKKGLKIFISYAKEDEEFAMSLYNKLKRSGFDPWIDVKNIVSGELWENAIQKALKESTFFIACLSNKSVNKRGYVQKEFRYALEKWNEYLQDDIYFIPLKIDNCEMPDSIGKFQCIDYFNNSLSWTKLMESLTKGIRKRNKNI